MITRQLLPDLYRLNFTFREVNALLLVSTFQYHQLSGCYISQFKYLWITDCVFAKSWHVVNYDHILLLICIIFHREVMQAPGFKFLKDLIIVCDIMTT